MSGVAGLGQLPAFELPAASGGRVRSWDYKSRRHLVLWLAGPRRGALLAPVPQHPGAGMRNLCACVANRVTLLRPTGWGFSPRVSYLRRVLANYPAGAGIRQRRTHSVPPWGELRGWIDPCRPTNQDIGRAHGVPWGHYPAPAPLGAPARLGSHRRG